MNGNNLRQIFGFGLLLAFVCCFGAIGIAHANEGTIDPPMPDSVSAFEGVRVDSIVVETKDVFDVTNPTYDRFIYRAVNWLHFTTKKHIVAKEVLLAKGMPFSWSLALETERNIRDRCDVYTATVTPEQLPDGRLLVRVETVDQWSLSGGISFRKEGDAFEYDLGFKDDNLLGYNHRLVFDYSHPAYKQPYITTSYEIPRLQFAPLQVFGWGTTNREAKGGGGGISKPFYDRLQRTSFVFSANDTRGTYSLYDDSVEVAGVNLHATSAKLAGFYRWGTLEKKAMVGVYYAYIYDDVRGGELFTDDSARIREAHKLIPTDSNYHEIGVGLELRKIEYMKTKRIDRSDVVEDFVLGPVAAMTIAKPFNNGNREEHRYSLGFGYTNFWWQTMVLAQMQQIYGFDHSEVIRKTELYSLKLYNRTAPWMTSVFHARFIDFDLDTDANGVTLGGFSGLRGYPQRFLTGNRVAVLSSELRFYSGLEIASVGFGAALFADGAGCWKDGQEMKDRPLYGSVGAGLRFFAKRVAGGATFRVDAAYSEKYGLQISVGTGQYFSAKGGEIGLTIH